MEPELVSEQFKALYESVKVGPLSYAAELLLK